MVVPVSVTHPGGQGLVAAQQVELQTAGPFARLSSHHTASAAQPPVESAVANASRESPAAQPSTRPDEPDRGQLDFSVVVSDLDFYYPGIDGRPIPDIPPVVRGMSFRLAPGSRCLLIGPNGAGKTTLLKLLGGKHLVAPGAITVLGQPPFHHTSLTSSGALSYLGGSWTRDLAFAGYSVPLQGDFSAEKMIGSVPDVDPARRAHLMRVLDVDPAWRMHTVSDGQRRRVQLCLGLLKPFKVLLLDEITVDLDVLGRADLMAFLEAEARERGATIIYATHIYDGLEAWPTHLMTLAQGQMKVFDEVSAFPELAQGRLLDLVERWLREEKRNREKQAQAAVAAATAQAGKGSENIPLAVWNNGWAPGRLTSSLSHSTNTVMRM